MEKHRNRNQNEFLSIKLIVESLTTIGIAWRNIQAPLDMERQLKSQVILNFLQLLVMSGLPCRKVPRLHCSSKSFQLLVGYFEDLGKVLTLRK